MARFSMNEMTTYRWSFEEDVQHYRAAGVKAIGVWRRKLSDYGEERGIELLKESRLAVSNLLWAGGFTGSEGHTHRESIDDALEAVQLAAEMRANCLVVYSGSRAGHTHNHARRLLIGALKEVAAAAAERAVVLALEPMHATCCGECTFLNSLDDAQAILDQVGSPQIKLSFDTYHMADQPDAVDRLKQLAAQQRIAIVHLADGNPPDEDQRRTRLGRGVVPLTEFVAALRSGGYDGDFDVELFGDDFSPADYQTLLRESQDYFAKLVG
ncbi:MAG: sugar phosphate isomerase/epimerase [Pirellulales bacterium]|nr:sugar phosphate isomerase/epimerase [Pirellulales bacterium]